MFLLLTGANVNLCYFIVICIWFNLKLILAQADFDPVVSEPQLCPTLWLTLAVSPGDDSMRMSHLKVGSAADIPLDIGEFDLSQLTASLTTPSGREEPCLLKMLRNGHVGENGSQDNFRGKINTFLVLIRNPYSFLRMFSAAGISFVPKEIGEHLVNIKKNGRHIPSSPIAVMISQSEIGDASRVRVSGQGLSEARTFEPAEFIIDTRDAGKCIHGDHNI